MASPVSFQQLKTCIGGIATDVLMSVYHDRVFIIISQVEKMGTMVTLCVPVLVFDLNQRLKLGMKSRLHWMNRFLILKLSSAVGKILLRPLLPGS